MYREVVASPLGERIHRPTSFARHFRCCSGRRLGDRRICRRQWRCTLVAAIRSHVVARRSPECEPLDSMAAATPIIGWSHSDRRGRYWATDRDALSGWRSRRCGDVGSIARGCSVCRCALDNLGVDKRKNSGLRNIHFASVAPAKAEGVGDLLQSPDVAVLSSSGTSCIQCGDDLFRDETRLCGEFAWGNVAMKTSRNGILRSQVKITASLFFLAIAVGHP